MVATSENAGEPSRENWDSKLVNTSGSSEFDVKMSDVIQRKCKNVISKLQRRIDKEGQHIIPLLTDLWKRIENSGYMSGSGNNHMDLQKIDQRVDRLEYSGVMELVPDVQLILKSAMQFYGFSHEVRSEARKVHDLFFDLLKIAFPDTDFREARNALAFSGPVSTTASGTSARQCKRPKLVNEVESDSNLSQKTLQRGSTHAAQWRLTLPGELVICKKRRKDREKSTVKHRSESVGTVSPRNNGRDIRSPGAGSVSKDARPTQQNNHQQGFLNQPGPLPNCSIGIVGWANHVKKMRTDVGKRRPGRQ
ncbi:hypothetical protein F3Y22_tig00016563pilonHSYRG00170 [Hibiscus syriacus]|uniref:Bromo domain-containing protein n=1 Tax=Hibiscus syriacus TaxID=106335 RepID=A0A6A3C112_HIBSY|nr:hypothetical protein F3Y22_tig00016563pilonHSYRG00170 [Hibiscus syriacus]